MIKSTLLILVAMLFLFFTMNDAEQASALGSVDKVQSGLVASDSLKTGNTAGWTFDGTASNRDYYEDSSGLHMGIKSPSNGNWVDYYAGRTQGGADLFHSRVSIADSTVPDGVSNVGIYVEGADYIPHVGCEAYADSTGHYWVVEQSYDAGQTYNILYITQPNEFPQTQDCTIITNGDNLLKVYIGGSEVFSSTSMSLGMQVPLRVYFQDDTSSSSSMHYATYSDYYATTNQYVRVTNNPSGAATVKILDASDNVLASSAVSGNTATLDVGQFNYPISGMIKVYDSTGSVIASGNAQIYGGDVYSYSIPAPTVPQSPSSLSATAISSSQIDLSWSVPANDGGATITGYKIERSTGGAFSVIVSNTGTTSTTYSDAGLAAEATYTYRVSAVNSIGSSSPSNTASATTPSVPPTTATLYVNSRDSQSNPIFGFYTELYKAGSLVASGYTPTNFVLDVGQSYVVRVENYGAYVFGHWSDTGSTIPNKAVIMNSDATITAIYKTVPQPPTNLSTITSSSSQIDLSWSAPTNNGGSPITGYEIQRSQDGGTTWSVSFNTTSANFSDTGLEPNTTYTYRVLAMNSVGKSLPSGASYATTPLPTPKLISKTYSGLVNFDPLNNETKTKAELVANQSFWHYNGSAFSEFSPPAPTELFKDSQGIHIGVQTTTESKYAGFFAQTPPTDAKLFHAIITTPVRTISHEFFQNGLYVQTWNGSINYVTCVSITSQWGTSWHIIRTLGSITQATWWEVLWSNYDQNQPLTRDCTIITNGDNYLKVYLDGSKVYENSTMDLQMPGPFLYFLEPQNPHTEMLTGIYKDYYATKDETIKISDIPDNASRVDLLDTSGNVISSAQVSAGIATIDVGKYHFPLAATIKMYDTNNFEIASTVGQVSVYGGDAYLVEP